MSEPTESGEQNNGQQDNRRHFIVDLNTVFGLFGKSYFLIFYFGRHLHPRQREQLVNQRTTGNWLVITLTILLLAGFIYAVVTMIAWRLGHDGTAPGAGSFTELNLPATTHSHT